MRVMICDDEPLALERLQRMLEKQPDVEVVGEARNGADLIKQLPDHQPDLVITDIRMPGMDGLEAAQHIAELESPPAVVFCTAHDEYAIQAFQVQAIGYLVKPVRQDALAQVLHKATRINRAQMTSVRAQIGDADLGDGARRQFISARSHRGIELVPVDQVRYFKADQKYVTVRYPEGEVLIDDTLRELEHEFGDRFIRVHRSALVALNWVEGIEHASSQYQLRFNGIDDRVPVSRRHSAQIRKQLKRL